MASIHVKRYTTVASFLEICGPALYVREWHNSIPLGIYPAYLTSSFPPNLLSSVEDPVADKFILLSTHQGESSSEPVLMICKSPSFYRIGAYSTQSPDLIELAPHIVAAVDDLERHCQLPTKFNGDERLVLPLAEEVASRLGRRSVKVVQEIIAGVVTTETLSGTHRTKRNLPDRHTIRRPEVLADKRWKDRMVEMYAGMFLETNGEILDRAAGLQAIEEAVKERDLWVYMVDEEPAAMSVVGRPTKSGKSVKVVFTEAGFRRKGFAEILVGELTRTMLMNEGIGYSAIFWLKGEVAGRVYQRVGYGVGENDAKFVHVEVDVVT